MGQIVSISLAGIPWALPAASSILLQPLLTSVCRCLPPKGHQTLILDVVEPLVPSCSAQPMPQLPLLFSEAQKRGAWGDRLRPVRRTSTSMGSRRHLVDDGSLAPPRQAVEDSDMDSPAGSSPEGGSPGVSQLPVRNCCPLPVSLYQFMRGEVSCRRTAPFWWGGGRGKGVPSYQRRGGGTTGGDAPPLVAAAAQEPSPGGLTHYRSSAAARMLKMDSHGSPVCAPATLEEEPDAGFSSTRPGARPTALGAILPPIHGASHPHTTVPGSISEHPGS